MKYECFECKFETDDRRLWHSHKLTKMHAKNVKQSPKTFSSSLEGSISTLEISGIKCQHCGLQFKHGRNLSRHLTTCANVKLNDYKSTVENERKVEKLETENNFIKLKLDVTEKQLQQKNEEIEYNKRMVASLTHMVQNGETGKNGQNSISAIKYLLINNTSAPPLKTIADKAYVVDGDTKKFVKLMISAHRNKMLHKMLGDIIIKEYRKDNLQEQSMFNSDPTRLSYIVRSIVDDITSWINDKNGKIVASTTIIPLLKYVGELSQAYSKEISETLKTNLDNNKEQDDFDEITDQNITLTEIKKEINNKSLQEKINKYIAPFFYLKERGVKYEPVKLIDSKTDLKIN